jgi:hypothetical protein
MTARVTRFPRDQRGNPLPLRVAETMPLHQRLPAAEASLGFAVLNHEPNAMGIALISPESICRIRGPIVRNVHKA